MGDEHLPRMDGAMPSKVTLPALRRAQRADRRRIRSLKNAIKKRTYRRLDATNEGETG